ASGRKCRKSLDHPVDAHTRPARQVAPPPVLFRSLPQCGAAPFAATAQESRDMLRSQMLFVSGLNGSVKLYRSQRTRLLLVTELLIAARRCGRGAAGVRCSQVRPFEITSPCVRNGPGVVAPPVGLPQVSNTLQAINPQQSAH